jgi:hypothetical protein
VEQNVRILVLGPLRAVAFGSVLTETWNGSSCTDLAS